MMNSVLLKYLEESQVVVQSVLSSVSVSDCQKFLNPIKYMSYYSLISHI